MHIKHSKPFVDEEDIKAISEQVKSQNHATGDKNREFETAMANLIGHKYARATSSGTTALHIALLALNIKKGDEVIIPDYVCQDVLHAVHHSRATPVLADIDPTFKTFNITAKTIKPLINDKTKAIILPYLFGIGSDIDEILSLGIPVIEDCAQSLGVKYKDRMLGYSSIISIFSFYATKIISTGQGGMILTSSEKIRDKIEQLTTYDKTPEYTISYNYNLTDIQAALGISQLNKLDFFIKRRKEIAKRYDDLFNKPNIKIADYQNGFPFRYVIKLKNKEQRESLQEKLKQKEIDAKLPVFKPLHKYLQLDKNNYPNSEEAFNTILSIPIYPALTDEEVDYIMESVKGCFESTHSSKTPHS